MSDLEPSFSHRSHWLRVLPVAVVAAHITACLCGLAIDWLVVHVVGLLSVAVAGVAHMYRGGQVCGRWPVVWALPALAWLLWLSINGPAYPPSPDLRFGRVAVDATMFLAAALVMSGSFAQGLAAIGQGALAALFLAMAAAVIMRYPDVGLGMMNHLLAFTVPVVTAWMVWVWSDTSPIRRRLLAALFAVVLCWCLVGGMDGPRRGAIIALLAGVSAPAVWNWGRRHPRLAAVAMGVALAVAIGMWVWAAGQVSGREFRTQRIGIWSASWEGVTAWWPWGGGAWSSLRISDLTADAARVVSSGNAAFDHPHNEILGIVQDQGLPGLLIALFLVVSVTIPLLRQERTRMQDAALALLASTLIFALVDNAYSLPACRIMLGISAGLVGLAGLEGRRIERPAGRALSACLLVAGMMAAVWAAWQEIPAATLSRMAPSSALVRPLGMTCTPQAAERMLEMAFSPEVRDLEDIDALTSLAIRRFGTAPSLVRWRYRAVSALAASVTAPIPGRKMPVQGSRVLIDELHHLTRLVLHADPFIVSPYRFLVQYGMRNPQILDGRLVCRAGWLFGNERLPEPTVMPVADLDEQADLWAVLNARLARGTWDGSCHDACDRLLRVAGACQGVAKLAVAVIAADPGGSAMWMGRHAAVLRLVAPVQAVNPR